MRLTDVSLTLACFQDHAIVAAHDHNMALMVDGGLAAKPEEVFDTSRGDPTLFLTHAFQSMWGHFAPNA